MGRWVGTAVMLTTYCVVAVWGTTVQKSQRTYRRQCECEYMVDGRCAYTLLLPTATGQGQGQCPQSETPRADALKALRDQLKELSVSTDQLRTQDNEHNKLLMRLQSLVLDLQAASNGTSNRPAAGGSTDTKEIGEFRDRIARLESQLRSLLNKDSDSTTGSLQQVWERVNKTIANVTALQVALSRANEASNAAMDKCRSLEARPALCQRYGALRVANPEGVRITASSSYNATLSAAFGRLTGVRAWCSREPVRDIEWLQFELPRAVQVCGVATKGRADFDQWVTKFRVMTGISATTLTDYSDMPDVEKQQVFEGNSDRNSLKVNRFLNCVSARVVRVIPLAGHENSNMCMRADVIGCLD